MLTEVKLGFGHLEHMEMLHFQLPCWYVGCITSRTCWRAWCVSLWGWGIEELRKLPPCPLFPRHGIFDGRTLRWQSPRWRELGSLSP